MVDSSKVINVPFYKTVSNNLAKTKILDVGSTQQQLETRCARQKTAMALNDIYLQFHCRYYIRSSSLVLLPQILDAKVRCACYSTLHNLFDQHITFGQK
jgi:hypothetical protein